MGTDDMMCHMKTVFLAMSGGTDSAFSAYLLMKEGYRVRAFTFALLPRSMRNIRNPRACCSEETIARARRTADSLGIPHYVINLRDPFEEHVITRFIEEYRSGRTPNPCVLCNKYIKFASFLDKARALGADAIATGHYARVEDSSDGPVLKKGKDRTKDQSYFLYPAPRERLKEILFPVGGIQKSEVQKTIQGVIPSFNPLRVRESQDICFIPDNDYRAFISLFISPKRGAIVTREGKQIGEHAGIHFYTVGQRRGLKVPYEEPLYVTEVRPQENLVVVGPKEHLRRNRLVAGELNMLTDCTSGVAAARVRYRQQEEPCRYRVEGDRLEVIFDSPVSSITPGQSVVLYEGETVLGGGVIDRTFETAQCPAFDPEAP